MSSLLEIRWMLPPFVICLILVGIHGYLGIHVLSRKVIFVDLALAQIAALGTTYAFMLGYDPKIPEDAAVVYWFSLGFTVLGAAVFSITKMRHEPVPHEAFIGITYAPASALAILILSKTPGEGEHLKTMLVGNILLVTWPQIAKTAAIYAAVGAFHFAFFRRFRAISEDPASAEAKGLNVRLWDFLFYLTFGFVITSSVSMAGVLLVFTYLVVPGSFAMLYAESFPARLAIAWIMGTVCSLAGMILSYTGDLPTGPAVVGVFALVLILGGFLRAILSAGQPARAAGRTAAAVAVLALALYGSLSLRKVEAEHRHETEVERLLEEIRSGNETAALEAIHHLTEHQEPHAVAAIVARIQDHPSDRLLEHAATALAALGDAAAIPGLFSAGKSDLDPDLRLTLAEAILRLHGARGLELVLGALEGDPPLLARRRALTLLRVYFGQDFGYEPESATEARAMAVRRLEAWWKERGPHLRWLSSVGKFE